MLLDTYHFVRIDTRIGLVGVMLLELETYTPREAEGISGMSQVMVRNNRRAGHLDRHEGRAKYDLPELLIQTSFIALGARGIGPDTAKPFVAPIARAVFQSMLYSSKMYAPEVRAAAREAMGEIDVASFAAAFVDIPTDQAAELLSQASEIRKMTEWAGQSFGLAGLEVPSWVIIWANGEIEFYSDAENDRFNDFLLGNIDFKSDFVQGPVILFSMGALAQMVIDRLPRPAIRLAGKGD